MYGIIGNAPCMQKMFKLVERVAKTHATVLIQGESGTGKELIARAIHQVSPRKDKPLIPVNCGAIPEDLLESELFGHVRGAFTGAAYNRPGRFELANKGTLFLDEIGDMSPKLQVKMLRVLQERIIEPVGSVKSQKVDVRVIAATHKDLEKEVAEGRFREDLFYRLNVFPIVSPPLRERGQDIATLIKHFFERTAKDMGMVPVIINEAVMSAFLQYTWPGNVRELENLSERLCILSDDKVAMEDLPEKLLDGKNRHDGETVTGQIPAVDFKVRPVTEEESRDFNKEVESFENQLILSALDRTNWNKNKAAKLLNLNRTTLVEKIKKKGLERTEKP
ncbi:MAG: sigma 54-interacting transcriptional regulator [Magnetococcales bacterium]|nr:sigma 54-interacting transcriptional regulator [Magnetococcales bacterium]